MLPWRCGKAGGRGARAVETRRGLVSGGAANHNGRYPQSMSLGVLFDMSNPSQVVLSGFADEAAHHQTAVQQFSAFAALGLQYYSIRFIDAGGGAKNVMKLTRSEITAIRHLEDEYGLNVASIGSPIGKVKLLDVDDGTKNPYIPFKKYLEKDVKRACELAHAFETKLIRGFSFYPPRGSNPEQHIPQVVDQLGQIAEMCLRSDLTLGVEIEANLVGCTGPILAEIHRQVNEPAMVLVFDAGNISSQGYTPTEMFEQYLAMKPAIGWIHIKDYRHPGAISRKNHTDEEKLKHFVPVEFGDSAPRSDSEGLSLGPAQAGTKTSPPGHPGRVCRAGAAFEGRRTVRRRQRARRDGSGLAELVPHAGLRRDRISLARLRRHLRGARLLELVSEPVRERGTVPICCEDCANLGQSPRVSKPLAVRVALGTRGQILALFRVVGRRGASRRRIAIQCAGAVLCRGARVVGGLGSAQFAGVPFQVRSQLFGGAVFPDVPRGHHRVGSAPDGQDPSDQAGVAGRGGAVGCPVVGQRGSLSGRHGRDQPALERPAAAERRLVPRDRQVGLEIGQLPHGGQVHHRGGALRGVI